MVNNSNNNNNNTRICIAPILRAQWVGEIKVSSDWFGCILVIPFYIMKVLVESVTKSSSCFTNVFLFTMSTSYAVDGIAVGKNIRT